MKAKKFFKGALVYVLDLFLIIVLVLLAYFTVFATVTANPARMKSIVADSGVYQKITPVLYDNFAREAAAERVGADRLPLENEMVRNAVAGVFTPQLIQHNLETAINGTYIWLNGDAPEPAFSINLADAKDRFADRLAEEGEARALTLPLCDIQQRREARGADLLSLPCRPSDTDIAALKAGLISSASNDEYFLNDTVISPATLKDGNGRSVFEDYKGIPDAFQTFKNLPYILGVLAALICAAIVLLNENRRQGLKKLIKFFVIVGVLVILVPLGMNSLINSLLNDPAVDVVVRELLSPVVSQFIATAGKVYYAVGAIYLLVAGAIFLAYRRMRPATETAKGKKPR